MNARHRPGKQELIDAAGKTLEDLIAPDLPILFCGINPGLYSGATGHHFARPGNRFWPTLHAAGFTPSLLSAFDEHELLTYGYGITNLVRRATAKASELSPEELREGGRILERKVMEYRPRCIAMLGIDAYRKAFLRPRAVLGRQAETIHDALLWVLPSPSGLNAHFQLRDLARLFHELRLAAAELNQP